MTDDGADILPPVPKARFEISYLDAVEARRYIVPEYGVTLERAKLVSEAWRQKLGSRAGYWQIRDTKHDKIFRG